MIISSYVNDLYYVKSDLRGFSSQKLFSFISSITSLISIVNANRDEYRFFKILCDRVDVMHRCHLYLWLSNRWLNVRMQVSSNYNYQYFVSYASIYKVAGVRI